LGSVRDCAVCDYTTYREIACLGHDYRYGVCYCGDNILPDVSMDLPAGIVTIENIPPYASRVILTVNAGDKMIFCVFGNTTEPVEIPVLVLQQGDSVEVFYLDDWYVPVLKKEHITLN